MSSREVRAVSFSSRVKEELIPQPLEKPCCVLAETAALTQATGTLGFLGAGRLSVTWRMENAALARRVFRLLREGIGLKPQLHFVEHARLGGRRTCVLTVEGEDAETLLVALRMAEREPDGQVRLRHTSPRPSLGKDCCRRAYLRGAFLGCGSINEPEKSYRLECAAADMGLAQSVQRALAHGGVESKVFERRGHWVVYLHRAQDLADTLAMMGASRAVMELENLRITKQMRSNANRASNCDEGNSEKQVTSAHRQVDAIKLVSIHRGLYTLPPALQEIARLRLEHPEVTLEELGQLAEPPVGRAAVHHRLKRLEALAGEIEASWDKAEEEKHETERSIDA